MKNNTDLIAYGSYDVNIGRFLCLAYTVIKKLICLYLHGQVLTYVSSLIVMPKLKQLNTEEVIIMTNKNASKLEGVSQGCLSSSCNKCNPASMGSLQK
jgi:hypothetical protein